MQQEQREAEVERAEAAAELEVAEAAYARAERAYAEGVAEREVEEGRKREEEALAVCYATAKKTPSEENLNATYRQLKRMEVAVEVDLSERLVDQVTHLDVLKALGEIWPDWDKTRRNLAHLEARLQAGSRDGAPREDQDAGPANHPGGVPGCRADCPCRRAGRLH
jgi:hypothetical protein